MNIFKKGISGLVATSILIVVSVVAVVSYQAWLIDFDSKIFSNVEKNDLGKISLEHIEGNKLFIKNIENGEIEFTDILINGQSCNLKGNISSNNLSKLNLGFCTMDLPVGYKEVSIITNEGIITKHLNLKFVEANNFSISYINSKSCSQGLKLFGLSLDKNYITHIETPDNNYYNNSLCIHHPYVNFNLDCINGQRLFYLGNITNSHIWFDNSSAYMSDEINYNWQEICIDSDFGGIELKFGGSWSSLGYLPLLEYYENNLYGGMTGFGFSHSNKEILWIKLVN